MKQSTSSVSSRHVFRSGFPPSAQGSSEQEGLGSTCGPASFCSPIAFHVSGVYKPRDLSQAETQPHRNCPIFRVGLSANVEQTADELVSPIWQDHGKVRGCQCLAGERRIPGICKADVYTLKHRTSSTYKRIWEKLVKSNSHNDRTTGSDGTCRESLCWSKVLAAVGKPMS